MYCEDGEGYSLISLVSVILFSFNSLSRFISASRSLISVALIFTYFSGFLPSIMVTHAYMFSKDRKYVRTFASYEEGDELFSDRNVFPIGCIVKMEKVTL